MSTTKPVAYGASGYLCRLACEYLGEYNVPFVAAGRSSDRRWPRSPRSGWPGTSCRAGFEIREGLPKTPTGKISQGPPREEFGTWATARA